MIRYVTIKQLSNVINGKDTRKDYFIAKDTSKAEDVYVACDNTTGDAFTEDFISLWGAIRWLTLPILKSKKRSDLLRDVLNDEHIFKLNCNIDL